MTSGSNDSKRPNERSLAKSLGALFALTSGLMLSSASATNAAASNSGSADADGVKKLEIRVQKIQEQLGQDPGTQVNQGDTPLRTLSQCGGVTGTTGIRVGAGTTGIPAGAMAVGVMAAGIMAAGTTGTTGVTGRQSF